MTDSKEGARSAREEGKLVVDGSCGASVCDSDGDYCRTIHSAQWHPLFSFSDLTFFSAKWDESIDWDPRLGCWPGERAVFEGSAILGGSDQADGAVAMFKPTSLVHTSVPLSRERSRSLIGVLPLLSGFFVIESGFDGVTAAAYLRTAGEVKGLG